MRLTLRTLLAYLDGNLEPEDANDIGKKIEESEFASKLVQAIRECVQRPRLGSPPLVGRGLGADPNTVAEYLEYRLGDERVPEFERICLESEVHLAEVASCHQILTLVLGEPADIEPSARQRMYGIAAEADAPPAQVDSKRGNAAGEAIAAPVMAAAGAQQASTASHATPPPAPPVTRRAKPEVPEYLRENRTRVWPVIAAVLVAATLTFAGLYFFGPAPLRNQITALVSPTEASTEGDGTAPAEQNSTPNGAAQPSEPAAGEAPATDSAAAQPGAAPAAAPADAALPVAGEATGATPAEIAAEAPAATPATDPYAEDATPADMPATTPAEAPAALPAGDPSLVRPAGEIPATDSAGAPLPPVPMPLDGTPRATTARPVPGGLPVTPDTVPAETMPAETMPAEPGSDAPFPTATADAPALGATTPEVTPATPPVEGFGRYTSTRGEVLLRFDPASGEWMRSPAGTLLQKGDRLQSLPLFQPTITLSSNFTIQADGATSLELVGWDEAGAPIIKVDYGRLLIDTIGRAGNSLRLQLDGHEPLITFVDPQSTLALEVRRELPPGKNPQAGPAPLVANVYSTSGIIRVANQDAAPVELQAPAVMSLLGSGAQPVAGEFPAWVNGEVLSDADRGTAAEVEGYLTTDMPVGLQLREVNDPQHKLGRKRNVRSAAARSLTYLDSFEPSIDALNDPDLNSYWHDVRLELQRAIARSPETAARVQAAFIKKRGQADGQALDRMLWGYTANDVNTGSDRILIDALGRNDALDFRVLGIAALKEIKGGASHGYRPDAKEYDRRQSLSTWKKQIGKLAPRGGTTSRPADTK